MRDFTLAMVRRRGEPEPEQLQRLFAAGHSQKNVPGVVLGLSRKAMSNCTNHVARAPVDEPFKQYAWNLK
jgi:hypothetical protein